MFIGGGESYLLLYCIAGFVGLVICGALLVYSRSRAVVAAAKSHDSDVDTAAADEPAVNDQFLVVSDGNDEDSTTTTTGSGVTKRQLPKFVDTRSILYVPDKWSSEWSKVKQVYQNAAFEQLPFSVDASTDVVRAIYHTTNSNAAYEKALDIVLHKWSPAKAIWTHHNVTQLRSVLFAFRIILNRLIVKHTDGEKPDDNVTVVMSKYLQLLKFFVKKFLQHNTPIQLTSDDAATLPVVQKPAISVQDIRFQTLAILFTAVNTRFLLYPSTTRTVRVLCVVTTLTVLHAENSIMTIKDIPQNVLYLCLLFRYFALVFGCFTTTLKQSLTQASYLDFLNRYNVFESRPDADVYGRLYPDGAFLQNKRVAPAKFLAQFSEDCLPAVAFNTKLPTYATVVPHLERFCKLWLHPTIDDDLLNIRKTHPDGELDVVRALPRAKTLIYKTATRMFSVVAPLANCELVVGNSGNSSKQYDVRLLMYQSRCVFGGGATATRENGCFVHKAASASIPLAMSKVQSAVFQHENIGVVYQTYVVGRGGGDYEVVEYLIVNAIASTIDSYVQATNRHSTHVLTYRGVNGGN